jgi:hypothetical protein
MYFTRSVSQNGIINNYKGMVDEFICLMKIGRGSRGSKGGKGGVGKNVQQAYKICSSFGGISATRVDKNK